MRYANCTKTVIGGLSLLLVLSGCSSGSKTKTAAAPTPQTMTEKTVVVDDKTVVQQGPSDRVEPSTGMAAEPANYDRSMDAAVSHVWKAEAAGDAGNIPEMLRHTRTSLEQATAAQRTRTADVNLNSGIQDLKETLVVGSRDGIAPSALRDARVKLVRARTVDTRTQTVRGELTRNDRPTAGGVTGGEQYIVRDSENHEMPIALSPEASQQVQVGDTVEVQIDSAGRVTSINKAQ
jgi:hypothetical protein